MQALQEHSGSQPESDTVPSISLFSQSDSNLSLSAAAVAQGHVDQDDSDSERRASLDSEDVLSDNDNESGDDETPTLPSFSFSTPSAPPQLDTLALPSPLFGSSMVDLLSLSSTDRPQTRLRTSSRASMLEQNRYAQQREPSLNFSKPREVADQRTRREGKEEDAFVAPFPFVEVQVSSDEPERWSEKDWLEVASFVEARGYKIDISSRPNTILLPATRVSDGLELTLSLVPSDDSSLELDILEHLSSLGVRSNAKTWGAIPIVPIVGFVPLSESWTAVLSERWTSVDRPDFSAFTVQVAAAIAFLHSNHIAHLSLTPSAILASPTKPYRFALTSFLNATQTDPFSKRRPLISGAPLQGSEKYAPPEMKDETKYDPFAVDVWAFGKVLLEISNGNGRPEFVELIKEMTSIEADKRPKASAVYARIKSSFSS